jgi:hypothetical protein
MTATCPACGRRQRDGLLCDPCTRTLRRDLHDAPQLATELDITLAKQARTQPPATAGLALERTAYSTAASNAATRLIDTLTAWSTGIGQPAWYITTAAQNLLDAIDDLRAHADADKLHREITGAADRARRTIDTPPLRSVVPVGPCPDCDGDVNAYLPSDDSPAYMTCQTNPTHRWDSTQWYRVGRRMLRKRGAA